jgi:RND family efflux transporter MFP subunit
MIAMRRVWICNVALAAALVVRTAAAQDQGPVPVVVSPVIEREVAIGQTFVGTVMPSKAATIGSAVDGRVIAFPLNEGDRIAKDGVLAQLLTDTITLQLKGAEAELDFRKQELLELENYTRPEELEQARARMNAAKAKMDYLGARRARAESLYKSNRALTEEELDEAVSVAIEAEEAFRDAQAAYQLAVEGARKERIEQYRARVAIQEATVQQLRDQLEKHTIRSRFDGYVTAEHTEVGQWVSQGDPVAEVIALDFVEVQAQVVEQYIPFIHEGSSVRVEIPALPDRIFTGEVVQIVPQADVQARTFPVKIRVKNEIDGDEPLLKAGMYARVMLPTGKRQMAVLVHKDSIVLGGPLPIVFVVESGDQDSEQGKAKLVPVRLGISDGPLIQVSGMLQPGQQVVVRGNERLRPGQDVVVAQVLPIPPAGGPDSLSRSDNP